MEKNKSLHENKIKAIQRGLEEYMEPIIRLHNSIKRLEFLGGFCASFVGWIFFVGITYALVEDTFLNWLLLNLIWFIVIMLIFKSILKVQSDRLKKIIENEEKDFFSILPQYKEIINIEKLLKKQKEENKMKSTECKNEQTKKITTQLKGLKSNAQKYLFYAMMINAINVGITVFGFLFLTGYKIINVNNAIPVVIILSYCLIFFALSLLIALIFKKRKEKQIEQEFYQKYPEYAEVMKKAKGGEK